LLFITGGTTRKLPNAPIEKTLALLSEVQRVMTGSGIKHFCWDNTPLRFGADEKDRPIEDVLILGL
jgi:hypothetical protein